MNEVQVGILLKHDEKKHQLIVLDQVMGRVTVCLVRQRIAVGSILEYQLSHSRDHYYTSRDINIVYMPLQMGRNNIHFLHQLLEVTYHFIPIGMTAGSVFQLLHMVVQRDELFKDMHLKKFILARLFWLLGIVPEVSRAEFIHVHEILSRSIDIIGDQHIDLTCEGKIDWWLQCCIQMHPKVHTFKTFFMRTFNDENNT